ncbi:MAG: phosphoribosylanthranilate isomerase [Acidobacteriota bacterium]
MTLVKICGIRTIEEALAAQNAGTWAIGQVFAPSKRRVSIEEAAAVNHMLSESIVKIGVFMDEPFNSLCSIANECGLDIVQLHGSESPEYVDSLPMPVIKTFKLDGPVESMEVKRWCAWGFLFDTGGPGINGGSGTSFDWSWLDGLYGVPNLMLAGGLNPHNVQQAIKKVKPMAVDVSSGVEYPEGGKDPVKIKDFIQQVKEADANVSRS